MNIKVITAPSRLPVTVEEVKSHCRVEIEDDDLDIENKIKAVVATLDPPAGRLGRAMITQTLKYSIKESPPQWIKLPYPPVQSISSITYINDSEIETTISSATYYLKNDQEPAYAVLKDTESWPTDFSDNDPFPFKITFVAGYGDNMEDVPEAIRLRIMMEVADLYLQRENITLGQSISKSDFTRHLLDSYIWYHPES